MDQTMELTLKCAQPGSTETPTPPIRSVQNFMHVTVKQLHDAAKRPRHNGRLVVNNSQVFTVQLCGMVADIKVAEDRTDYILYDGTGSIPGRIWALWDTSRSMLADVQPMSYYHITSNITDGDDQISLSTLKAVKVTDHNEVTRHFLRVIYEHLDLTKNRPIGDFTELPAHTFSVEKEGILSMLDRAEHRLSEEGASFNYLLHEMQMAPDALRKALQQLLDEGSIYNTIDYYHYKIADDKIIHITTNDDSDPKEMVPAEGAEDPVDAVGQMKPNETAYNDEGGSQDINAHAQGAADVGDGSQKEMGLKEDETDGEPDK